MGLKPSSIQSAVLDASEIPDASKFGTLLDDSELGDSEFQPTGTSIVGDPIKAISGSIDKRIQLLSYSSLLTLHACPRKFQLYKLKSERATQDEIAGVTFAFGHVVGQGIQDVFEDREYKDIVLRMFAMWDSKSLFDKDEKRHKSFSEAVQCIRKFRALREAGFLEEYELVYVPNPVSGRSEPACELGFAVSVFDGFTYRGFVDAVLRNKITGEIVVLECKTTWMREVSTAAYKNSGQALGYSVVLDSLFPGISSYSVLYLVYSTTTLDFNCLPFAKSFGQRAEWIRSLVFDVEDIARYEEIGFYPKRGESCNDFFRECEYFNVCNLSTSYLAKPCTESEEEIQVAEARYTHKFTLAEIIEKQVARNTA